MGKLFGTDGVRGVAGVELTAELAFRLGLAVGTVLKETTSDKPRVLIGKDTRLSGDMFESAMAAGLMAVGSDVCSVGVVPTPAVAYLVREIKADAGVMISASHNPSEYNGIKVFGSEGYKLSDALEARVEELTLSSGELAHSEGEEIGRALPAGDLLLRYERHVSTAYGGKECPTRKRVLLDLANGSASATAEHIFTSENFPGFAFDFIADRPNGVNINRNCGSTKMEILCRRVKEEGYDVGIAFDGDADRCLMCDENGILIDGDMLISAMAIALKNEGRLKENKVVVTKLTNLGFHHCMKAAEIEVPVTDVGDRYVLEEMLRCGSVIGGEQSGHVILLDYATTGDGQITASMALRLLASQSTKTASQVFGVMTRLPQVSLNVTVPNARKKEVMTNERVLEKKTAIEEALADSGRILLRPSGTEALIRIMLEGSDTDALLAQANELKAVILEILG